MSEAVKFSELKMLLQAETLDVSRQINIGDKIKVETVTREHQHVVDEALQQETVEVTRVAIGREVATAPDIVQDGDLTIIPVVEEVVVVTRKLILKEEIHLKRVRTSTRHQENVMLRAQEAIVTREAPLGQLTSTEPFEPSQEPKS